ncbi:MAG: guanylate kinase [Bacteroidota bacterium]
MARGKLVVISAPSGAGKTTIARAVLAQHPAMVFSVSATTRPIRAGEEEGRDYFFLTKEEFQRRISAGAFVEWEEIYGHLYGTMVEEVDRALTGGRQMLFDVDVKGGLSIKRRYPEACLIFIRPPSIEVLEERLRARRTEDSGTIERRMQRVPMEMELGNGFDREVVNDDLSRAVAEVNTIVNAYLMN